MNCKRTANTLWLAVAAAWFLGTLCSRADALQDGQEAYKKGDYAAAERAFETALSAKGPNAGLYYNLGMAQLKNAQRPEATLSFHRALLLDPLMADAQVELSNLDRTQGVPAAPADWRDKIADKVPLVPLVITGTVIAWAGGFLLLFGIFKRGRKFGAIVGAIIVLILGKGLVAAGCLADPRFVDRSTAVIVGTESVTLLAAPADQSAVVSKLPAGATLKILHRRGDWTYCETPSGDKGWTMAKTLVPVVPAA